MRVEDCFGRFVELVESVVQRFGEARAGFRQLERTRQALEQLDAEEVLQCLEIWRLIALWVTLSSEAAVLNDI